MMNILCVGYRDWALNIYDSISKKNSDHIFTICRSEDAFEHIDLNKLEPDIIFFYGWSKIIDERILQRFSCFMLHPSRLPLFRGGSPLQNQLINGLEKSAVTIFKMTKDLDAGPIYFQEDLALDGDLEDIFHRITTIGIKGTNLLIDGNCEAKEQNHSEATYFKRRRPEQSEISLSELNCSNLKVVHNKVRMLQDPYPNAFIKGANGEKLYILKTRWEKS